MKGADPICGRCELPVAGVESLTCPGCGAEYHRLCGGKLGHCAAVGCGADLLRPPSHPGWPYARALVYAAVIVGGAAFAAWRAPLRGEAGEPGAPDELARLAPHDLRLSTELVRLRNVDAAERLRAAVALGQLGPGAAEAEEGLATRLGREADANVRVRLCEALGSLGEVCTRRGRDSLRKALGGDRSAAVRVAAAKALGHVRDRAAVAVLSSALAVTDLQLVKAAAAGLGRIRAPDAVEPLRALLARPTARALAVAPLGEIGWPARIALPDLLALLREDVGGLRPRLLGAVGAIAFGSALHSVPRPLVDSGPVVAALARSLGDPAATNREAAARALVAAGEAGGPAVPGLLALLLDVDQPRSVRRSAARTLDRLGLGVRGSDVAKLRRLLQVRTLRFEVRCALRVLGRSGIAARAAIPEIVRWGLRQGYGSLAVESLRGLGSDSEAVRALGRIVTGETTGAEGRVAALGALAELRREAAPALVDLVRWAERGPPAQRSGAVRVLRHIPSPEATSALIVALKDPTAQVRQLAVEALAGRADRARVALPALVALETDPDAKVVRAAQRAAAEIEKYPVSALGVDAKTLESELRCVYCRDRIDGRVYRCPGCHTTLHQACHDELAVCPALGCAHTFHGNKVLATTQRNVGAWVVFVLASVTGVAGVVATRRAPRAPRAPLAPLAPNVPRPSLDVGALTKVLRRDSDPVRRRAAAAALARDLTLQGLASRRREVLPLREPLVAALGDTDPVVRLHVARCLERFGRWLALPPARHGPLLAACGDADPRVRRAAVGCLPALVAPRGQPSDAVARALCAGVDDADPGVRASAVEAARDVVREGLRRVAEPAPNAMFEELAPALARAAKHAACWAPALDALGGLVRQAQIDDLRAKAEAPGPHVQALREHGAALLSLAKRGLADARVRVWAVAVLAGLELPDDDVELEFFLVRIWRDQPELRAAVAGLLARLGGGGDDQLREGFVPSASPTLQRICAVGLARSPDSRARALVLAGLADPRLEAAAAAGVRALPRVAPGDLPALARGLSAEQASTRLAVVDALRRTEVAEAIPLLQQALGDRYRTVRVQALTRLWGLPAARVKPVRSAVEELMRRDDVHPEEARWAKRILERKQ